MTQSIDDIVRVGLLMDHPSPHMVAFLDALALRADCAVQVVYCRPGAPERRWGDPAGKLPHRFAAATKTRAALVNVVAVVRAMRAVRADVWVVNSVYTSPETWAAVAWLNAAGTPWVYMNEPPRPRRGGLGLKEALVAALLKSVAGCIGMGRAAEARYRELLGPMRSASVPYYIDLADFLALPRGIEPAAEAPIRFVTAAQLIARKGLDVLLAACEHLPAAGWQLTLAGDGPLRESLERDFARRWREGRVTFVGEVPYADRAQLLAGHDVFVFPSRWDGWGMAPVEALAAGLPVIATDQAMSMCELLSEGENGFLVPADDAQALAERMQWFMRRRERIPAMRAAARAALHDYRPERGAQTFVQFLSDIACAGRLGSAGADAEPLTWRALGEAEDRGRRLYHAARALAKRSVIDVAMLGKRSVRKPSGPRIMVYHLVLSEDRRRFEDHLRYLQDHFRFATVSQLAGRSGRVCSTDTLAISFDDGFRVLMFDALELLEKHGIKATFYIPTRFIELAGDRSRARDFCRRVHHYRRPLEPMTVDDVRTLHRLGHEIGSHGVSHIGMGAVSRTVAVKELAQSRSTIEAWVGHAPAGFAYPYGEVSSSVCDIPDLVNQAGYDYAVTLRRGALAPVVPPMLLPREHAEGNWRVRDLAYFLSR